MSVGVDALGSVVGRDRERGDADVPRDAQRAGGGKLPVGAVEGLACGGRRGQMGRGGGDGRVRGGRQPGGVGDAHGAGALAVRGGLQVDRSGGGRGGAGGGAAAAVRRDRRGGGEVGARIREADGDAAARPGADAGVLAAVGRDGAGAGERAGDEVDRAAGRGALSGVAVPAVADGGDGAVEGHRTAGAQQDDTRAGESVVVAKAGRAVRARIEDRPVGDERDDGRRAAVARVGRAGEAGCVSRSGVVVAAGDAGAVVGDAASGEDLGGGPEREVAARRDVERAGRLGRGAVVRPAAGPDRHVAGDGKRRVRGREERDGPVRILEALGLHPAGHGVRAGAGMPVKLVRGEQVEDEHGLGGRRDVAERPVARFPRIGRDGAGPGVRGCGRDVGRHEGGGVGRGPRLAGLVGRREAVVVAAVRLEGERGRHGSPVDGGAEVEDVVPGPDVVPLVAQPPHRDDAGGGGSGALHLRRERRLARRDERGGDGVVHERRRVARCGREVDVHQIRVVGARLDGEELVKLRFGDDHPVVAELRLRRAAAECLGIGGPRRDVEREHGRGAGRHVDVGAVGGVSVVLPEAVVRGVRRDEMAGSERLDRPGRLRGELSALERHVAGQLKGLRRLQLPAEDDLAGAEVVGSVGDEVLRPVLVADVGGAAVEDELRALPGKPGTVHDVVHRSSFPEDDAGGAGLVGRRLAGRKDAAVGHHDVSIEPDGAGRPRVEGAAVDHDRPVDLHVARLLRLRERRAVGDRHRPGGLEVAARYVGDRDACAGDHDVVRRVTGRGGRGGGRRRAAVVGVVPVAGGEVQAVAGRAGPGVRAGVCARAKQGGGKKSQGFVFHGVSRRMATGWRQL